MKTVALFQQHFLDSGAAKTQALTGFVFILRKPLPKCNK